jgi:regulatory protein
VNFCIDHNYLDDLRYAKSQIRQHVYKGHGEPRIRQELSQKRVSESVIEEALQEEPQDWFELAKAAAEKVQRHKSQISERIRQASQVFTISGLQL